MKYLRTHIPTGEKYIDEFNISHHSDFHHYNVISRSKLMATAKSVVERWNNYHPDTWHYEVLEEVEDAHNV
jgi:hypothetical protein